MICPNCKRKTDTLKSVIIRGGIVSGCPLCLGSNLQKANDRSAKYYKQEQQRKFKKELIQPIDQRDFISAYGIDKARDRGYSEEDIRKYSI